MSLLISGTDFLLYVSKHKIIVFLFSIQFEHPTEIAYIHLAVGFLKGLVHFKNKNVLIIYSTTMSSKMFLSFFLQSKIN